MTHGTTSLSWIQNNGHKSIQVFKQSTRAAVYSMIMQVNDRSSTAQTEFFSIGGKFNVLDSNENILCKLQGKWTSWDFKFVKDTVEFGHVSKEWTGIGQELFTSADNYMLKINDCVPQDHPLRVLILSAVICIDMVLKE